jgi:hypothetical protein
MEYAEPPNHRRCPICNRTDGEPLHEQRFILPEGYPLAERYTVWNPKLDQTLREGILRYIAASRQLCAKINAHLQESLIGRGPVIV